jgi:transposase
MGHKHSDEFRREAVRIALTSGLTRRQVAADLGVGFSTLSKWIQLGRRDEVLSAPQEDLAKENGPAILAISGLGKAVSCRDD